MNDSLFIALQRITPQNTLSRLAGFVASSENDFVKRSMISWFVKKYRVDMSQALEEDPFAYANFNAFFTRALKPDARPIDTGEDSICCPADGSVSQIGNIEGERIFQAKGQSFSTLELLGGDTEYAALYQNGLFTTVYLSPRDYHRVHLPFSGKLVKTTHIPGKLFSVNTATAANVPRLFARNERVACHFETSVGPMTVVLIGAMIVASIETVWAGLITPIKREVRHIDYGKQPAFNFEKGEEIGRFLLGSTAIVLLPKGCARWNKELIAGSPVVMGQRIGTVL